MTSKGLYDCEVPYSNVVHMFDLDGMPYTTDEQMLLDGRHVPIHTDSGRTMYGTLRVVGCSTFIEPDDNADVYGIYTYGETTTAVDFKGKRVLILHKIHSKDYIPEGFRTYSLESEENDMFDLFTPESDPFIDDIDEVIKSLQTIIQILVLDMGLQDTDTRPKLRRVLGTIDRYLQTVATLTKLVEVRTNHVTTRQQESHLL